MTDPTPTPLSLTDLVDGDHDEPSLLATLLADTATARSLAAWRKSVADLEAARAAAAAACDEESVRRFDADAANDYAP
jgi:hypothetical protein